MGRAPIDAETIYSYVGNGAPALISRVLGKGATKSQVDRALEFFLHYYNTHLLDQTTLYPGAKEALRKLANGTSSPERTMAILTNKPVYPSQLIIDGLGLADLFPIVYGGNSFGTKKPDPHGLNRILKETRVEASAAMMVGDSDVDIQTGVNAGSWTCGITHGFGNLDVHNNPPDLVVDTLLELAAHLE